MLQLEDINGNIEFLVLFNPDKCSSAVEINDYSDFINSDHYLVIKIIDHRDIEIY
ncbi:hypothetical protein KHQ81_06080 [Mycoplasmatota bacterium]|nr:hypothetical protein KHQ81_06080 [Mycoplasmatota bacterium]